MWSGADSTPTSQAGISLLTVRWGGNLPQTGGAGGRLPRGPLLRCQPSAPGHFQATPQEDVENPPVVLGEPEKWQRVQQLVSPRSRAGGDLFWVDLPSHMRSSILTSQESELSKKRKKCESLEQEARKKQRRCEELVSAQPGGPPGGASSALPSGQPGGGLPSAPLPSLLPRECAFPPHLRGSPFLADAGSRLGRAVSSVWGEEEGGRWDPPQRSSGLAGTAAEGSPE